MSNHDQRLARIARIERRRRTALVAADRFDHDRHAAIVDALDHGASLTAIADVLDVSRQALTRYLSRREHHA